ncbi:glycoside hydrolase family 25 protein [Paenibacillus polymyxa]|uniref:glycoside hydrolase family 25 protein n=1 Tax=Paenibacillus polymyxa TaxID=1406 RepID=UPI0009B8D109|nr:glycoside hydrolase family 25 protein [Paenibacillus polymyxa]MCH6187527.1 glycoside hydrolase family 25 protein [Paenibacillus polymyxa]MDY8095178.1 glycoside hydrolase family 25 protein [Paenibacillus polymyxa]WRL59299.1 glycoside hydrolase family 25 protein [Paenibacillus polymyxa]
MQRRNSRNARGIDVSRYQGKIDWKAVKADGISFAFIKASQGQRYVDPTFTTNAKGARAVGVLPGAYHFLDATTVEAAKAEARHFAEVLEQVGGGKTLDLPPVMDYENNRGNLSKTLISAVALAFLLELERLTGRKPIVYTGNAFAANFNASLGGYPLWIARYSDTRVPSDTVTWKRWDIWQYSDSGKVAGIKGNVDMNEYDGTADELRERFTKRPEQPETVTSGTFVVNGKQVGKTLLYSGRTMFRCVCLLLCWAYGVIGTPVSRSLI